MAEPVDGFNGFSPDAGELLAGLAAHNDREWFAAHRGDYDRLLRAPLQALLADAEERYGPGRVVRPHRDVRFSADKSPYRTDVSLWAGELGGVYARLDATGLDVGGGLYGPGRDQLDRARRTIADDPDEADRLRRALVDLEERGFRTAGPPLITAPRGYRRDHPAVDLLRLVHYAALRRLPLTAGPDQVHEAWERTEPLIAWVDDHLSPGG